MSKDKMILDRITELEKLQDGWLNGEGNALSKDGITWFINTFVRVYPNGLSLPYIYPTVEGNLQLEWDINKHEVSLEIDLVNHKGEWHDFTAKRTHQQILYLNNDTAWNFIIDNIKTLVQSN